MSDREDLREYADIERTEIGEYCQMLLEIRDLDLFMSLDLKTALDKEIKDQLSNFREFSVIIEKSEEIKQIIKTKEIEWK